MENSIDISKMYGINNSATENFGFKQMPFIRQQPEQKDSMSQQNQGVTKTEDAQNIIPITSTDDFMYQNLMNKHESLQALRTYNQPFPITPESMQYLNGFLRTQIGRRVEVEFLIGNNLEVKSGYLIGVGANYILLNDIDSDNLTSCDFYNIKFIRFFY